MIKVYSLENAAAAYQSFSDLVKVLQFERGLPDRDVPFRYVEREFDTVSHKFSGAATRRHGVIPRVNTA